jgi:hypothetical protein
MWPWLVACLVLSVIVGLFLSAMIMGSPAARRQRERSKRES